jgi:acetyl-CoA C-acetyltransferase
MLPRHIGLYAGAPIEAPAHMVQRVCGTGIEALMQGADAVTTKGLDTALCVGAESMSRNPVSAYTHRSGFRMGQIEFKDFLWEALLDPAAGVTMGGTAENLARHYQITRPQVDEYAARSFERALAAQSSGFFDGEIVPVVSESFEREGYHPRGIKLDRKVDAVRADSHVRASSVEALAKIRPAFGGVQTGGNSSAVVDGAAAAIVCSGAYAARAGREPLARLVAGVAIGCPPEIMGIGPAPAIRTALTRSDLKLSDVDLFEVNEAFAPQYLAVEKELGLDRNKTNVDGGAIALGHPLGASGARITTHLVYELARRGGRYAVGSACIGGGQGIAVVIERV